MSYTSGIFAEHARSVLEEARLDSKPNTDLAYDSKIDEFKGYCMKLWNTDPFPESVTEEKVFGFLFYQSQRKPKKRGRKKV